MGGRKMLKKLFVLSKVLKSILYNYFCDIEKLNFVDDYATRLSVATYNKINEVGMG